MNEEIERLLKGLYKMSKCSDWDEGRAQEIVMWGGELYEKYFIKKPEIKNQDVVYES